MEDKEHAVMEVRRAAGNAGDASGNADAAVYLFESGDIAGAADRMHLAREQAEMAMKTSAQAEWRLRRLMALTPNDGVVGPADSVAGGRSHTNELLEGAVTARRP